MGPIFCITTVFLAIVFEGFSISSNIWLSVWSNDDSTLIPETQSDGKRLMHITVYGLLGVGQGEFKIIFKINKMFF